MVKIKKNIGLLLLSSILLLSSCSEDKFELASKEELKLIVLDENPAFSPVSTQKGFVFVTDKNKEQGILAIDDYGNQLWQSKLEGLPEGYENPEIQDLEDGYLLTFTKKDQLVDGKKHTFFGAIKTNLKGEKLWNIYDTIPFEDFSFGDGKGEFKHEFLAGISPTENTFYIVSQFAYQSFQVDKYDSTGKHLTHRKFESFIPFIEEGNLLSFDENSFTIALGVQGYNVVSTYNYDGRLLNTMELKPNINLPESLIHSSLEQRENGNLLAIYFELSNDFKSGVNILIDEYTKKGQFLSHDSIPIDEAFMGLDINYNVSAYDSEFFVGTSQVVVAGVVKTGLIILRLSAEGFEITDTFSANEFSAGLCLKKGDNDGLVFLGKKRYFGQQMMFLIQSDQKGKLY